MGVLPYYMARRRLFASAGEGEPFSGSVTRIASSGSALPIYATATFPAGFYDAEHDKTWFIWEAYPGSKRHVYATTYDHSAAEGEEWGPIALVGVNNLNDDNHGVPSLAKAEDGKMLAYFGSHETTQPRRKTTAVNDVSEWETLGNLSGTLSYPHPCYVEGAEGMSELEGSVDAAHYVFQRDSHRYLARWVSSIADGHKRLVDFGSDSRFYLGTVLVDGTDIHLISTKSDGGDNFRRNIYHFIYDATDGSIRNSDGTTTVATGSQPINLTLANSDFRLVLHSSGTDSNVPTMCFDTNGDIHVAFIESTDGVLWDIKHMMFTSGAWTTPTTVVAGLTQHRYTYISLVRLPAGEVAIYYPEDEAELYERGGNILRKVRSSGGSWGTAQAVKEPEGSFALDEPAAIVDAHADARVMFVETTNDPESPTGTLGIYVQGDNPLTPRDTSGASPAGLFASSEAGVWIDPSDASTCWQDTGATTAAGDGDPVRLIQDKSGNANHLTAPSDAARPIRRQDAAGNWYLDFDGSDDVMSSAAFASEFAQPNYVCVGVQVDAGDGQIFHGISGTKRNSLAISQPATEDLAWQMFAGARRSIGTAAFNRKYVATASFDGASSVLWVDTVKYLPSLGPGTEGLTGLRIGANAGLTTFLDGRIYGLVLRDTSFLADRLDLEYWMMGKTGVTL